MIILGIDPSLYSTGWALLESNTGSLEVVGAGSIPFKFPKGKMRQENAYRKEMFALPDDTLFSTEQTEFFACTSRGRIARHLKDGKIKQTNGFFKKSDVIQWRKAYPPENNGVSESSRRKLAFKLDFMLKEKEENENWNRGR